MGSQGKSGLYSTNVRGKTPRSRFQLAEESRLKAKRVALDEKRALALRTGSLYEFIEPIAAPRPVSATADPSSGKRRRRQNGANSASASRRSTGARRALKSVERAGRGNRDVKAGAAVSGSAPDQTNTKADGEGNARTRATRLQQTLDRYQFIADPVTSQEEALRSLQAKNSLYPILRFAQPWEERDVDRLDEYMSSSSESSSSTLEEDGAEAREVGGINVLRSRSRDLTAPSGRPTRCDFFAGTVTDASLAERARSSKRLRKELRRRRRKLTEARKDFNSKRDAAESAQREKEAAVAAAAASAAAAAANRRSPQVDVSKLAHFRYSKIKESLPLGSESEWVSDKLYEGSSRAGSEGTAGRELPPEYYGSGARPRFYDLYRLVHRQMRTIDDEGAFDDGEFSPRRLFLRDSLSRGSTPAPTVMRSAVDPYSLDLGFQGLGDKIGLSLATTLPYLPLLECLSLRDNRLTDASLEDILAKAIRIESLTSLDLSRNKIDDSANVLREYVASARCTLKRLSLSNADVDDDECNDLMEALATNFSVTALDLSHNMIGDKETYNFVRPDYTTGGEAIAEMLETNVTLSSLDLSWNSVRMASGVSLGQSLAHNSALTELKLAHNSLADAGVQAIAQSLRTNGTLKLLDISFNNMKPKSAMVVANALLDNTSLVRLMMSHNNVGRSGARAVFMALRQRARPGVELLVDLQSCELSADSGKGLFDMYSPSGRYDLDLSKPYDYMVGRMLLSIANKSEGCEMTHVEYSAGERAAFKAVKLIRRAVARTVEGAREEPNEVFPPAPNKFGGRILGSAKAGAASGEWQGAAEALLLRFSANAGQDNDSSGAGREAEESGVAAFFRELGLEPSTSILRRLWESLNSVIRARDEDQRVQGSAHCTDVVSHDAGIDDGERKATSAEPVATSTKAANIREEPRQALSDGGSSGAEAAASAAVTMVRTPFELAKFLFELLFLEADVDCSGCIDHTEFGELLKSLGRDISPDVAKHCLASYDIDRSNTIESCEFVDFMTHEFLAAVPPSPGVVCEASSSSQWEIPREGRLRMTIVADFVAPAPAEVASQQAVDALISNIRFSAKTEQDRLEMFHLATEGTDFYMTSLSAQAVIDEWNNGINLVDILEVMLPQMASDRNVVSLIENNLTYAQKLELRGKMGQAWGPLVGNPTGTYCLDMTDRRHLVAARRLAMVNYAEKNAGITGATGRHDTSQRGYWNNFRNETFNGMPFPGRGIEGRWFVTMPPKGKLRLDYVSTARPLPGARPLSARRFRQLLHHLDLGDMQRSTDRWYLFLPPGSPRPCKIDISSASAADMGGTVSTAVSTAAAACDAPAALGSAGRQTSAPPHASFERTAGGPGNSESDVSGRWLDEGGSALPLAAKVASASGGEAAAHPKEDGTDRASASVVGSGAGDLPTVLPSPLALKRPTRLSGGLPSEGARTNRDGSCFSEDQGAGETPDRRRGGGQESAKGLEMLRAHAMIKSGELRPITPDQVLAFHAEFQVTTKAERRRAWAITEYGHPLVPDEDTEVPRRNSSGGGGAKSDAELGSGGNEGSTHDGGASGGVGSENSPQSGGGVGDPPSKSDSIPSAVLVDPKPNFGDKQKALYHVPLMWRALIGRPQYTQEYKLALSKLCELRVQALRHHLTIAQVITTMSLFPRFDFLRVIVATTLFGLVVDLENLDVLLEEFTQAEEDEFIWRIGPLNCHSPMKPDRYYDLDLTHRDDREICKILAVLAAEEPGENWVGEEYRWSYAQRPVPGWELPITWTTPDTAHNGGPRHFGRLTLSYSSDPATGCAPKWKLREALMAHVLAGHKPAHP